MGFRLPQGGGDIKSLVSHKNILLLGGYYI